MAYYIDLVSGFYIISTVVLALIIKEEHTNTALVALAITSAMALSGPVKAFVNVASSVNNSMANIQRMQEYT